jgi:hypothetical protein
VSEEIIYMVAGQDEHGDQHMVMTEDLERVIAHFQRMADTLTELRGNEAFENIARPMIDALAH